MKYFERRDTEKVFLLFLFFEVRLEYLEGRVWVERFWGKCLDEEVSL